MSAFEGKADMACCTAYVGLWPNADIVFQNGETSFDSEWFDPAYGNFLWEGLASVNAKTAADAYARWLQDGGHCQASAKTLALSVLLSFAS